MEVLEVEAHSEKPAMVECVAELKKLCNAATVLGSFPSAPRDP